MLTHAVLPPLVESSEVATAGIPCDVLSLPSQRVMVDCVCSYYSIVLERCDGQYYVGLFDVFDAMVAYDEEPLWAFLHNAYAADTERGSNARAKAVNKQIDPLSFLQHRAEA